MIVYWHEAKVTWIDDKPVAIAFPSTIMAICKAFLCWMDQLNDMHIRSPRIRVLVGRATWATAINDGRNHYPQGRRLMQNLAVLQLQHRVHFVGIHWKASGDTLPQEWQRMVKNEECTTNDFLQIDLLLPATSGIATSLCNRCVLALVRNIKNDSSLGMNSLLKSTFPYGSTTYMRTPRPPTSPATRLSSPSQDSIPGPPSRERWEPCDGCTACIARCALGPRNQ